MDFGSLALGTTPPSDMPAIDWRELLARLSLQGMPAPPMNVQGFVNSEGAGAPRFGGSVGLPALGGQLGLLGSIAKPDRLAPTDWRAMLNFKRQF